MRGIMVRYLYGSISLILCLFVAPAHALEFSLFGDTSYSYKDSRQSFAVGSFNLIADQHVSDTSSITTDLIFETGEHGIEVELERFKITKETELANITMGRFHKTLGFWNHNFNHGSLSQDTASRPFFLELENSHEGIFPAHLVGLLLGKEKENHSWQFAYANNSGMNSDEIIATGEGEMESLNRGDSSNFKTYAMRGTYRINDGLEAGLFLLWNNVIETGENAALTIQPGDILFTQEVVGLDFSYNSPSYYAFGELYRVSFEDNPDIQNIPINTASYTADAFYVQFGYRYSEKTRIAFRYETLDFGANSTFLTLHGLTPQTGNVLAINYRMEESNALRLEIAKTDREGNSDTSFTVQWFFYLL